MSMTEQNKILLCDTLCIIPGVKSILDNAEKALSIETKDGVSNIVTNVDKALEDYITKSIKARYKNAAVIGEETSESLSEADLQAPLKFVVDPLDGTTNYTNGWPHTVSIGIVYGDELVGGVVYDVLSDRVYFAQKGEGAFVTQSGDILVTQALVEYFDDYRNIDRLAPMKPYEREYKDIPRSVISTDQAYERDVNLEAQEYEDILYTMGASNKKVGPVSLDVVKTALGPQYRKGQYNHGVWHFQVRPWDLAGATCILRELGGEIIDKSTGEPLAVDALTDPNRKIGFFASGSPELCQRLNEVYSQTIGSRNKEVGQPRVLTMGRRA